MQGSRSCIRQRATLRSQRKSATAVHASRMDTCIVSPAWLAERYVMHAQQPIPRWDLTMRCSACAHRSLHRLSRSAHLENNVALWHGRLCTANAQYRDQSHTRLQEMGLSLCLLPTSGCRTQPSRSLMGLGITQSFMQVRDSNFMFCVCSTDIHVLFHGRASPLSILVPPPQSLLATSLHAQLA